MNHVKYRIYGLVTVIREASNTVGGDRNRGEVHMFTFTITQIPESQPTTRFYPLQYFITSDHVANYIQEDRDKN